MQNRHKFAISMLNTQKLENVVSYFKKYGKKIDILQFRRDVQDIEKKIRSGEITNIEEAIDLYLNKLPFVTPEFKELIINELKRQMAIPIKIVGIGRSGVGKTRLIKTLFKLETKSLEDLKKLQDKYDKYIDETLKKLKTNNVGTGTTKLYSVQIKTQQGFTFDFTDVVGLGNTHELDNENIPKIKEAIDNGDLVYYVMDASQRNYGVDLDYMTMLVDKNSIDKMIIVLNMADRIIISEEDEEEGKKIWDEKYNVPTELGQKYIENRVQDLLNYVKKIGIKEDQIVACSSSKSYNLNLVLNKFIDYSRNKIQSKVAFTQDRLVRTILEKVETDVRTEIENMTIEELKEKINDSSLDHEYKNLLQIRLDEKHLEKEIEDKSKEGFLFWFKKIISTAAQKAKEMIKNTYDLTITYLTNNPKAVEDIADFILDTIGIFRTRGNTY